MHIFSFLLYVFLGNAETPMPSTDVVHFKGASWLEPHIMELRFTADAGHKVYVDSISLAARVGQNVTLKNLEISPVESFKDKFTNVIKKGTHGDFTVTAEVYASESIRNDAFPFVLNYQACSEEYCLFPQDYVFEIPLYIQDSSLSLRRLMAESWVVAIIFVFFAGFLTSFTPCIFPMIPLTLAVLVPRQEKWSFSTKLYRSLSYIFGIAVTYSILGVIAASSGLMFGALLGNKWVALSISFFFVAFAISMLGFFEIKSPSFMMNSKILRSSNTFVYGLAAGVIAGPCVGPVLLSILTYISQTGDVRMGFVLMMSFALGMGLIFVILGTGSDLLKILPKSGAWLNSVKYIFAIAMVALALYYAWPVLSIAEFVLYASVVTVFIALTYLLFFEKSFSHKLAKAHKVLLVFIVMLGSGSGLLSLVFSDSVDRKWGSSFYENGWVAYDDKSIAAILSNGKPTIIDFYADWCLSCKELKQSTFSNSNVIDKSREFNLIMVDATNSNEIVDRLKKEHRILGLPSIIFYSKDGKKQNDLTLNGFENAEAFLTRMNRLQNL